MLAKEEFVLCPVCASAETSEWRRRGDFLWLKCSGCGLIFIPGNSYSGDPARQYQEDETSPSAYYAFSAAVDRKNFNRTLEALEQCIPPGLILDVGSSIGTFLEVAQERGWQGVGVEPNPVALRIGRAKGLEIFLGYFDSKFIEEFRKNHPRVMFDAVHMGDVLEHVFRPVEFLHLARRILGPGGYITIVTPDIDSFFSRLYQVKPREHLVYFNPYSLKTALSRAGFLPLTIKRQRRHRALAAIPFGTTALGGFSKLIVRLAAWPVIGSILDWAVFFLVRDELLAIARVR